MYSMDASKLTLLLPGIAFREISDQRSNGQGFPASAARGQMFKMSNVTDGASPVANPRASE
jgi:hypothetical protein